MEFDVATLRDLTADHITTAVLENWEEGIALEFKQEPWSLCEKGKQELLKDIVAMANARGGFIVVGVVTDQSDRAVEFQDVENVGKVVERVRHCVADRVEPPLRSLETSTYLIEQCNILVIRVPDENPKPRWVKMSQVSRRIPIRVADGTNEMTLPELRDAILRDPTLRALEELKSLVGSTQAPKKVDVDDPGAFLKSTDATEVQDYRFREFCKESGDRQMYWLSATPSPLSVEQPLRQYEKDVSELIRRPPEFRKNGWDLTPTDDPKRVGSGLEAQSRINGGSLMVAWNGHTEFSASTDSTMFQWAYLDMREPRPFYLDPRAFSEPAALMMKFMSQLVQWMPETKSVIFSAALINCADAQLIQYPPNSHGHVRAIAFREGPDEFWVRKLKRDQFRTHPVPISVADLNEDAGFSVVNEIYREFGFDEFVAPFFDEKGIFVGVDS